MDLNLIKVKHINEEEMNNIRNYFSKYEDTKNYGLFGYIYGIFYEDNIIGVIGLDSLFDNLSITVLIKEEYRNYGIAGVAINKLIDIFGNEYSHIERFYYDVSPQNISSNKAIKKIEWKSTSEFDDIMLNEGGQFLNIYYKNNPYYKKKK